MKDRSDPLFADIRNRFSYTLIHKEQFVPCCREQRRGVRWPEDMVQLLRRLSS